MKIKCKCGNAFSVPPEVTSVPEPRVTCPHCRTSYRLRRPATPAGAGPGAPSPSGPAGVTAPPPLPPGSESGEHTEADLSTVVVPGARLRAAGGLPPDPRQGHARPASSTDASEQPTAAPIGPTDAARAPPTAQHVAAGPVAERSAPRPSAADAARSTRPAISAPPPAFSAGELIAGRYRIERFLAQGGMGEVYAAEDVELQERVALKTIGADRTDPETIDRFKREISLARRVTHPNVCRIFDLGQHVTAEGQAVTFLTMELLHGETLAYWLGRHERLPTAIALPLARQIAAALDAAHQAQVVHRDLKSENVFLVQGDGGSIRAVVTDFGIARAERGDPFAARVTGTKIVGTPAYMAPEQVVGDPVSAAADVYAFGVVLYEMVTGRLPFESDNPLTVAARRLQEPPRPPRDHLPGLDERWERVIVRCLERRPEDRFASCGEAIAMLESRPETTFQETLPPAANAGDAERSEPRSADLAGQEPVPSAATPETDAPAAKSFAPGASARLPSTARSPSPIVPADAADLAPAHGLAPPTLDGPSSEPRARPARSALGPLLATLVVAVLAAGGLQLYNRLDERHAQPAPRRSVAVVGFHNLSGQPDHAWLATALTEMIGTELARSESLRPVPRDQVARMKQELELDDPSRLSELSTERLRQVHGVLGCDFVVTGTFLAAPPHLRVDLRLADAAVGTTLASFAQEGSEEELFDVVRALGADVRERLGVQGSGGVDPLAGLPTQRQAARLYSEGLDALERFDARAARDALAEAARAEPANPLIHLALSSAWKALGHDGNAASEAERAFQLSSNLAQEDRLAIQGHYQETRGAWPAAAGVYRQLWEFFPDNLEYGLRLAAAETSARRPAEALAAIARLRELPPPASEDPRIDLAEAAAAEVAADYDLQLAASRRGAGKAEELGASLLAASARLTESQACRFLGRTQEAVAAALDSLDVYREVDHPTGSALALLALANAHFDLSELDEAAARSEEAIAIYRDLGDEAGLAWALNNLALILKRQGDVGRAASLYEEAQQTFEATGNRLGLANAINNQATLLILRDELAQAEQMLAQAQAIWDELGDPSGRAFVLNNLAVVDRLQGDLEDSRRANEEALAIRRRLGQKLGEVFSLSNLGGTLADLGELGPAAELLGQCQQLAAGMGHRSALGYCLHKLAEVRLHHGELDEALRLHEEALSIREELGEQSTVAESRSALARLRLERREPAAAEADARMAVEGFGREGRRAEQGMATALLAQALADQDRLAEARTELARASELGGASQQLAIRFRIGLTEARLAGRTQPRPASERLRGLEQEAAAAGFVVLALEARLDRLLLEGDRDALSALRAEAEAAGVDWIASRIDTILAR